MNAYQADIVSRFGVPENAFFQRYSDMYVGCESYNAAVAIRDGGPWKSMASTFRPNKGSDMDRFPWAVDIPFAYLHEHISSKLKTTARFLDRRFGADRLKTIEKACEIIERQNSTQTVQPKES